MNNPILKTCQAVALAGGDPSLILAGYALAMANVCELLIHEGFDSSDDPVAAMYRILDTIRDLDTEAELAMGTLKPEDHQPC